MSKGKEMWARYSEAEMALAMANGERMEATRALTAAQKQWEQAEWAVKLALAELEGSRMAIVDAIDAADLTNQAMPWVGPVEVRTDDVLRWGICIGDEVSPASSEPLATGAAESEADDCNVMAAMGADEAYASEDAFAEAAKAADPDDFHFPVADCGLVDSQVDSWADEACVGDQLPGRAPAPAETVMATAGPVQVDANGRSTAPELHYAGSVAAVETGLPKKQLVQLSTAIAEFLRTYAPTGGAATLADIANAMSGVSAAHLDAALANLVGEHLVVGLAGGRWVTRRWWLISQVEEVMGDNLARDGVSRALVIEALLARCSSVHLTHLEANEVINAASKLGIVVGDRLLRRPRPYTLHPETRQAIAAGIAAGRSLNSIAVEFGVSWSTVDRIAKELPTAPLRPKKSRRAA